MYGGLVPIQYLTMMHIEQKKIRLFPRDRHVGLWRGCFLPTSYPGSLSVSSLVVVDGDPGRTWSRVTKNLGDKKISLRGRGRRVVWLFRRQIWRVSRALKSIFRQAKHYLAFWGVLCRICCWMLLHYFWHLRKIQVLNRLQRDLAAERTRCARTLGKRFNVRGQHTHSTCKTSRTEPVPNRTETTEKSRKFAVSEVIIYLYAVCCVLLFFHTAD